MAEDTSQWPPQHPAGLGWRIINLTVSTAQQRDLVQCAWIELWGGLGPSAEAVPESGTQFLGREGGKGGRREKEDSRLMGDFVGNLFWSWEGNVKYKGIPKEEEWLETPGKHDDLRKSCSSCWNCFGFQKASVCF